MNLSTNLVFGLAWLYCYYVLFIDFNSTSSLSKVWSVNRACKGETACNTPPWVLSMVLGTPDEKLSGQGKNILAKLEAGELLTGDELHTTWRIIQASENRCLALLKVCGAAMFSLLAGIFAVKFFLGLFNEEVNAMIFMAFFLVSTVIFFARLRHDNYRSQIEARLRCHSCGEKIDGIQVRKLSENNVCPYCSESWPLKTTSDNS